MRPALHGLKWHKATKEVDHISIARGGRVCEMQSVVGKTVLAFATIVGKRHPCF